MVRSGDVIENPLQGQRIQFRQTSADTGGALVEFDSFTAPGGFVPVSHRHWKQDERFEMCRGVIACRLGFGTTHLVRAGESLHLPPNTPHVWWNPGEVEAHSVVEIRPALEFDIFLETLFALAAAGQTNGRGSPRLLQSALIARRYRCYLGLPPVWMQRPPVAVASALGRAMGIQSSLQWTARS